MLAAISFCFSTSALAANPQVELRTSMGSITLELYQADAPNTVKNFLQYVNEGFYNGTVFHRVMPGFVVQGGGFTPDMKQKPTREAIKNEAPTGHRNAPGTIAMARTADPHSATAQFFINLAENRSLDFKAPTQEGHGYTVFGRVVDGLDVVAKITGVPTGSRGQHANVPLKPVVIERATVKNPDTKPKGK